MQNPDTMCLHNCAKVIVPGREKLTSQTRSGLAHGTLGSIAGMPYSVSPNLFLGRLNSALDRLRKSIEMNPNVAMAHFFWPRPSR